MQTNLSTWVWGGAALAGGLVLANLSRLSNMSREFVIVDSSRIHSASATELVVAVDLLFKNPTDAKITLRHPTIKLFASPQAFAANDPFVTSVVEAHIYQIAANGETQLRPVLIRIPLSINLLFTGYQWLRTYLRGEAVHLIGKARAVVNGSIVVEKLMPVTVQKAPPVELLFAATANRGDGGIQVRTRLTGTNRLVAQRVTTRIAIYATEADRSVDAPLWEQRSSAQTAIPANRANVLLQATNGLIEAARLLPYTGLKHVLVQATLVSGNRQAEKLITVNLPA
jgi:hypothetical protein